MSPTQSYSTIQSTTVIDEHKSNGFMNDRNNIKLREYINSAVYIEKSCKINSCNQTIYFPGSGDHPKTVTVKRCACFTNPDDCPCHPQPPKEQISQAETEGYGLPNDQVNVEETVETHEESIDETAMALSMTKMKKMLENLVNDNQENDYQGSDAGIESCLSPNKLSASCSTLKLNTTSHSVFESDSGITVRASNSTSDLRLSIPSLTSLDTVRVNEDRQRGVNFREWCRRKDTEKKMQEEREQLIQKIKEQQKQAVLELERENFKRWLANKRKLKEEETKKLKQKQEEEEKRKEEEKNKRLSEKDQNYQTWLRKKEKHELEKKIQEQFSIIEREELKERRKEINQKAYEYWREQSKTRQKPVPFGMGIDTLKSSASVSYINPIPWVPNIEPTPKPHSQ